MLAGLLFKSIEKQAAAAVAFEAGRCLRTRLRNHDCERCVEICPGQALTKGNGRIALAEERCTGCQACVSACPGNAFSGGFDLLSLLAIPAGSDNEAAILGCGKSPHHHNLSRIPCFGLLSEPVLVGLHCLAKQEILLDVRHCADCENGKVASLLRGRIQGISGKMATPASPRVRLAVDDDFTGIAADDSRRFFLRMTKKSLFGFGRQTVSLLTATDADPADRASGEKETSTVNLFLDQARALFPDEAAPEKRLLQSYYYELAAGDKCDLCPACTGMCPTGALKRRQVNGVKRLEFTSHLCSGCGLCVGFCKREALTLTSGARNDPALTVTIAGEC